MNEYGVIVNDEFSPRELERITAKGFIEPMWGRVGTYDGYVMKEIDKSYGLLNVEGKVVLDVGANIGCFSVWAHEHGAKMVLSMEPESNNFKMLTLNTSGLKGVFPMEYALTSDVDGTVPFFLSPTGKNPGNSSLVARRGRTTTYVQAISAAKFRAMYEHQEIEVVKLDCEGGEFDLLPIISDWESVRQISLEYHINGFGTEKVQDMHDMMTWRKWRAIREPRIQDNLWQTIATYVR